MRRCESNLSLYMTPDGRRVQTLVSLAVPKLQEPEAERQGVDRIEAQALASSTDLHVGAGISSRPLSPQPLSTAPALF
jgi:hypothetical protein